MEEGRKGDDCHGYRDAQRFSRGNGSELGQQPYRGKVSN